MTESTKPLLFLISFCIYACVFFLFSTDEDEELHSTDPESKDSSKDKKTLCKVKWSRDEVSSSEKHIRPELKMYW